ncbi:androgen-dependent TFPI-regulating protein [Halyomorpha halys]|uniref:androgen-dependent TFPI-regulating protein n=1 Tax=Halyomorpha halys TaxID=286706 RepID=UPI0006D5156A|nr:androgen-dependent TFPI-regulating protein-like [Halyomorpha halys]
MAFLEKILHVVFLGIYVFVFSTFIANGEKNAKSSDPNLKIIGELNYRFLTNWTYGMQLLYYFLVVFSHLISIVPALGKISNKVRSLADILFATIVIPFGLTVTISFWSLYAIDRELVYPSWIDKVIPVWMNHALHTFNSVFPLIDLVFSNHKFPSWSLSSICMLLYSVAYAVCFFGTYYTHGRWLYPMFDKLSNAEIAYYTLGQTVGVFLIHALARGLNHLIWGSSVVKKSPSKQSKKSKQKTKKVA